MSRRALVALLVGMTSLRAFGLDGTVVTDFVPSAARIIPSPGSAPMQAETTRATTQAVAGDSATLPGGWILSGTVWTLLDSLPTDDPRQVPDTGVDFSSRLLQLDARCQVVPGILMVDLGKQLIHPSSGFFKTPLDLISRGAAGNVPQSTPAASPQWEEGWVGAKVVGIVGDWSFEDFLAPALTWSAAADRTLQYLSLQQSAWQNQVRVDVHMGAADLQFLTLVTGIGLGTSGQALHVQTGAGLDGNVGDSLTVRAEATLADSLDRLAVADAASLSVVDQTRTWVPRALVGSTWSINAELSLMAEYYYDGLGFFGDEYASAIQYAKNRWLTGADAPDLAGQFGPFSLGRNYTFLRLADTITDQITGQGWTEINLQDLSGIMGIGIAAKYDHWGISGAFTQTWGGDGTEAQVLPYLWQLDAELQFYF